MHIPTLVHKRKASVPSLEQDTLKDLWQENPPDRADSKVEVSSIDAERDQKEPQKPKPQRYQRETKPETGEQGELNHKGFGGHKRKNKTSKTRTEA